MPREHDVEVFRPGSVERNTPPGNDKWTFTAKVDGQIGIVEVFVGRGPGGDIDAEEADAAANAQLFLERGDLTISGVTSIGASKLEKSGSSFNLRCNIDWCDYEGDAADFGREYAKSRGLVTPTCAWRVDFSMFGWKFG